MYIQLCISSFKIQLLKRKRENKQAHRYREQTRGSQRWEVGGGRWGNEEVSEEEQASSYQMNKTRGCHAQGKKKMHGT